MILRLIVFVGGGLIGFFLKDVIDKIQFFLKMSPYPHIPHNKYEATQVRTSAIIKDDICTMFNQLLSEMKAISEEGTPVTYLLPLKFVYRMDELSAELINAETKKRS